MRVEQSWEGIDLQLENGDAKNTKSTASVTYLVFEVENDIEAIASAYSEAPADISGIPKKSAEISERLAHDIWKIEISYAYSSGSGSSDNSDEPTVSFDTGSGSRHITNAISQRALYYASSDYQNKAGNFIGWNGKSGPDSVINGVDVPCAQLRETYTKKMRSSQLSTAFKRQMAKLVGCVNLTKWKGWEAGEAMFMGCSYSGTTSEELTVTFNFAIQPNEKDVPLGPGYPKVSKRGHEYVWSISDTTFNEASGTPSLVLKAVYAAQIVPYADFSVLGL